MEGRGGEALAVEPSHFSIGSDATESQDPRINLLTLIFYNYVENPLVNPANVTIPHNYDYILLILLNYTVVCI